MHRTREPLPPLAGQWWKFTRYELKDGYIRPAPDATLSAYDPWSEPPPGADTAYASLANLVPRERDTSDNGTVSPHTAAAVLAWCQQYGLLGVLLHRVEKIVLDAWAEDARAILPGWNGTEVEPERSGTEEETERHQSRVQFRRNPGGEWQTVIQHDVSGEGESPSHDPAGIMLHPIADSVEMVFEPFGQTWARFFPSVPHDQWESYRYPPPLSETFWALYCEPVEEFMDAATWLKEALTTLAVVSPAETGGPRDDRCWSRSLVSGRLRADHSRTERPCGNRPVVSPAETGRLRATMGAPCRHPRSPAAPGRPRGPARPKTGGTGIPVVIHVARADGLTGRGGGEAAPALPDL